MNLNLNFNVIIRFLQDVNQRYAITSLFQEREVGYVLTQHELIAILVILVIGLLWCFAGHLMVRLWAALMGLGLGFIFGALVASLFTPDALILIISGGVLGLTFGLLAGFILPLGVFLVTLLTVFGFMAILLSAQSVTMLIVALVIGLIFAIITFKFPIPTIIIITALCGAFVAAETLYILVNYNLIIYAVVIIALAVGGMCTQFLFENGRRKREHLDKANQIKENKSRDSEIEKARNLVDILEEDPALDVAEEKEESRKEKAKKEKPEKKEKEEKKSKKDKKQAPVIVFGADEDDEDEEIEEVVEAKPTSVPTAKEKLRERADEAVKTKPEGKVDEDIEKKPKEKADDTEADKMKAKAQKDLEEEARIRSIQKKEKAKKEAARLEKEKLEKAKREAARLEKEKLEKAKLEQAKLEQEKLEQARLEKEKLEQEKLEQAKLEQAKLEQAKLEQAKLEQARLEQIRLEQERLEQVRREQAKRDWINQLVSDKSPRD